MKLMQLGRGVVMRFYFLIDKIIPAPKTDAMTY